MTDRSRTTHIIARVAGAWPALALIATGCAAAPQERSTAPEGWQGSDPLTIGAPMPLLSLHTPMLDVRGEPTTIGSVRGEHGTLVVFTTNHCPWSQAWEGRITALGNDFVGQGVGVIAVNSNDPDGFTKAGFEQMQPRMAEAGMGAKFSPDTYGEMQRRALDAGMNFPYVVDETSDVARTFGATKTPEVYLFDRDQRLVYHGAVDDNAFEPDQVEEHYLREALSAVVAGRPVAHPEARSVGCRIAFRPAN